MQNATYPKPETPMDSAVTAFKLGELDRKAGQSEGYIKASRMAYLIGRTWPGIEAPASLKRSNEDRHVGMVDGLEAAALDNDADRKA